jgi:hypothetical protein
MTKKKQETDRPDEDQEQSEERQQEEDLRRQQEELRELQEKAAAGRHGRSPETKEAQDLATERQEAAEEQEVQDGLDLEAAEKVAEEEQARLLTLAPRERITAAEKAVAKAKDLVLKAEALRLAAIQAYETQVYGENDTMRQNAHTRIAEEARQHEARRKMFS